MITNYKDIPIWKDITEQQWNDWKWQKKNRITTLEKLKKVVSLTPSECEGVKQSLGKLQMAITPYYATLFDKNNKKCPIRRQAIPSINETLILNCDRNDPLHESKDSPVKGITHRYPDRVLFLITHRCAMYCRHCTRRRFAGNADKELTVADISYFIDKKRQISINAEKEDSIIQMCKNDSKEFSLPKEQDFIVRQAKKSDIPQMISLFSFVFETYPSPVFNKDYLEIELNKRNFRVLYSLSRAINPGINKVLSRLKYNYTGRLINNCDICGGYEDMNIWVKCLK